MKSLISKELMNVLACPECKGSLKLIDLRKTKTYVNIQGKLICKKCGQEYKIEDNIPCLLPKELV